MFSIILILMLLEQKGIASLVSNTNTKQSDTNYGFFFFKL